MASDLCPYCGNQLKKLPKRKAKCKECGGQIFVLEDQELFPSSLLTKDDALAVEYCEVMEFSKSEFENEKARLRQGFGQDPSSRDVMRGLFNGLVVKHIANFEGLVRTYGGHAN